MRNLADKPAACQTNFLVRVHVLERDLQGIGKEKSVGVQQNYVPALRELQGHIVGGAKAEVDLAAQDADMRKLGFDHCHRSIVGVVIHDEYLKAKVTPFPFDRLQGLAQNVPRVEGDDNERNVEWVRCGSLWNHAVKRFHFQDGWSNDVGG